MDPIVGEFTVTSWSDPAQFHTTFPRSVRLEDGYEIALKSISHGPVTNLVHNTFTLHSDTSKKELEITPRFYESPADVLIDVHKKIAEVAPVPLLYEQDGHIKMKMLDGSRISISEKMFLNRTFKYKIYDQPSHNTKRAKKQPIALSKSIGAMKQQLTGLRNAVGSNKQAPSPQALAIDYLITEADELGEIFANNVVNARLTDNFSSRLGDIMGDMNENLLRTHKNRPERFYLNIKAIGSEFKDMARKVEEDTNRSRIDGLEEGNEGLKRNAESVNYRIQGMEDKFGEFSVSLQTLAESLSNKPDDSTYSIDTSQLSSSDSQNLLVTELSVPMTPIVKTDLAFLYCSIVENSLVNNEETRVLTTIPITSRRGYNYFQFAQPIYRSISVRQFMDISFHILDVNENYMNFNLYGDDVDLKNRKYPTILNLHIRRRGAL